MTVLFADRIKETTSTAGTGTKTLDGAVTGFSAFSLSYSNNDLLYYCETNGQQWETGLGRYEVVGATRRVARVAVISNSNGNTSPISWPSGTREIYVTLPAVKIVALDDNDELAIDEVLKLENDTFQVHFAFGASDDFGFYDYTRGAWVWQYFRDFNGTPGDYRLRIYDYTYFDSMGADEINLNGDPIRSAAIRYHADAVTGTAQAGASTTITLASGASTTDDVYNGLTISLTGGTGSGQARYITDYVGSTRVATIDTAWSTTPDATSVYSLVTGPSNSGRVPSLNSAGRVNRDHLPDLTGATAGVAGYRGAVPTPTAGQHLRFLRGDATWAEAPRTYTETWRTSWAFGGSYSQAHGLGSYPDRYWLEMECTTTEYGYAVGDRVTLHGVAEQGSSRGYTIWANATNVAVKISDTNAVNIARRDTNANATVTVGNWKIRLRAERMMWAA